MKKITGLFLTFLWAQSIFAQNASKQDSIVNNLVHTPGYNTSEYGAIPKYIKEGKGKQTLILIPGCGFDASVFTDFMEENKSLYTMYAITIPGYGNTQAPPMPDSNVSYGEQTWNKGVEEGLLKLMENENLQSSIIVGHSTQGTQLALRMAIDYPDKVSHVIILGGHAKFIAIMKGEPKEFPLNTSIEYVDKYTAPNWFKQISKVNFDQGNYLPEIYSLDSLTGDKLFAQSATVALPVMIRYLCEFFASDIKSELYKIKCPVLILRAGFNKKVLDDIINNYVKPQFIDSWNDVSAINPLIKLQDIEDAATFVWKDNPKATYKAMNNFIKQH